jgi:hypothetical protein
MIKKKIQPPPENSNEISHNYGLGRHCKQRTFFFHMLHHYKYNLIQRIRKKLKMYEENSKKNTEIVSDILDDHNWVHEVKKKKKWEKKIKKNFF